MEEKYHYTDIYVRKGTKKTWKLYTQRNHAIRCRYETLYQDNRHDDHRTSPHKQWTIGFQEEQIHDRRYLTGSEEIYRIRQTSIYVLYRPKAFDWLKFNVTAIMRKIEVSEEVVKII